MEREKLIWDSIHAWLETKAKSYGEAERNHFLLSLHVFKLEKMLSAAYVQSAKTFELTFAEQRTLLMLRPSYDTPLLTPGDLMLLTQTTSGGMAKILKSLECRGLIERRPNPSDARSYLISLTPTGLELIDRIFPPCWKACTEIFSKSLTPEETAELDRLLTKALQRNEDEERGGVATRWAGQRDEENKWSPERR